MSCACLIWSFEARKTGPRFFVAEAFVLPAGALVFEFCAEAVAQTVSAHASAALSSLFIKVLLLGEVRRRGKRRTFCEGSLPSFWRAFIIHALSIPCHARLVSALTSNLQTATRRTLRRPS